VRGLFQNKRGGCLESSEADSRRHRHSRDHEFGSAGAATRTDGAYGKNVKQRKRILELEEETSVMAIKADKTQLYADNLTRSNEEQKQHNSVLMKELCAWITQPANKEPTSTPSYASVTARPPRGATITAASIGNQL
jgi:hypothetical protein